MTNQRHRFRAQALVFTSEATTHNRLNGHHLKEIPRNNGGHCARRLTSAGYRLQAAPVFSQCLQGTCLQPNIFKIGISEIHPMTSCVHLPEAYDLLRVVVRQWSKQDSINHAENRGGRSDTESENDHCNHARTSVLRQHAKPVAHVLPKNPHCAL